MNKGETEKVPQQPVVPSIRAMLLGTFIIFASMCGFIAVLGRTSNESVGRKIYDISQELGIGILSVLPAAVGMLLTVVFGLYAIAFGSDIKAAQQTASTLKRRVAMSAQVLMLGVTPLFSVAFIAALGDVKTIGKFVIVSPILFCLYCLAGYLGSFNALHEIDLLDRLEENRKSAFLKKADFDDEESSRPRLTGYARIPAINVLVVMISPVLMILCRYDDLTGVPIFLLKYAGVCTWLIWATFMAQYSWYRLKSFWGVALSTIFSIFALLMCAVVGMMFWGQDRVFEVAVIYFPTALILLSIFMPKKAPKWLYSHSIKSAVRRIIKAEMSREVDRLTDEINIRQERVDEDKKRKKSARLVHEVN